MGAIGICAGISAALGLMALGIFLSWETAQMAKVTVTIFNCSVVSASKVKEHIGEYSQYYYREVTVMIKEQNYTDPLAYCPDEACNYFNKTAYCFWAGSGNIVVNYDLSRAEYYSADINSGDMVVTVVVIIAAFLSSLALFIYFCMGIPEECRREAPFQFFRNNQYQRLH